MAGKSEFLQRTILNLLLGVNAYTVPATLHVALFTTAPTNDAGTGAVEVTGGAYARVAIANNNTTWGAALTTGGGPRSNAIAVTFPVATAAWGTITSVGVYDAATAGNLLFWATLSASKVINTNDQFTFPVGALIFTED